MPIPSAPDHISWCMLDNEVACQHCDAHQMAVANALPGLPVKGKAPSEDISAAYNILSSQNLTGHPCWKGAWPATDFNQPADDVRRFLGPISNPEGARLNPKTGRGTGGGRPWAVPDVSGVYLARDSNNRCCEPGSPVHTFKEDRCAQHRCSTVAKYHLVYTRDAATALLHQHCAAAAAGSTGATLESAFEKLQFANNVARFGSLAGQTVYYPKDGVALFIETAAQLRADSDSPRAKVASPRGKRSAPAPERSMSAPAAAGAAAGVRATRASRRRTTSSDGAQASPAAGSPAAAAAGAAEQPAAGSDHIAALAAELVHSLGPVLPALCSMSENPIADIMTAVGSMTDDTPMHAAQTIATYATLPHPPPLDTSGMHGPPATEGVPMSMEEAVRIVTDAMNSTPAQLAMQPATQAAASDRSGLTVSAAVSMRGPMQCNQADSALLAHNPSPHAEEVGSGLLLAGMQRPDTPGFPLAPVHATMTNTASQPSPQQSQGAIGMRERAGQAWSPLLCMGMQATQVAGGEQRAAQVLPSPAPQQQHRSAAMKCDTPSHRNRSVGHSPPETDTSPYADLPITAVPPPPSLRTTYAALSNPVQQVQTCMSAGSVLHKQDDTNGTDECTMQLVPHTRTPQHVWATHEVVAILVNPRLSLDQQRDAFAKLLSDIRVLSESGDDAAALQLLTGLREGDVHGRSLVQLLVTPRARLVDPTRSYYGDDRPADHEDGELQLALLHMALSDDSSYALSPYLRYQVLFAMINKVSLSNALHTAARHTSCFARGRDMLKTLLAYAEPRALAQTTRRAYGALQVAARSRCRPACELIVSTVMEHVARARLQPSFAEDIIYALDDQYFAGHTHTHSDTHTTNPSPQSTNLGLAMLRDVASQYRVRVREPDGAGGMSHLAKVQAWCTAWDAWHMPHRRHQTTEQQQALDVGAA